MIALRLLKEHTIGIAIADDTGWKEWIAQREMGFICRQVRAPIRRILWGRPNGWVRP